MNCKQTFIQNILLKYDLTQPLRIIDLWSGQSRNFLPFIAEYRQLEYIGIEPIKSEATIARQLLKDFTNATIYNDLAYEDTHKIAPADICISFSVLEHVKDLQKFLKLSVDYTKPGWHIYHRYDLGHALHPSSLQERLHVRIWNHLPFLLPERSFVNYVSEQNVLSILQQHGAVGLSTTYHQLRSHKQLYNALAKTNSNTNLDEMFQSVRQRETGMASLLQTLSVCEREKLFPTVCVHATKK